MPRRSGAEQGASWEEVKGRESNRLAGFARPWACMALVLAAAAVLHGGWPYPGTAAAVLAAGTGIAGLSRHLTHQRGSAVGRWLGAATVLAIAGWTAATVLAGLTRTILGFWATGGMGLCLAWNVWLAVRDEDGGASFIRGAERAGLAGLKVFGWTLHPHRSEGVVRTPPGQLITDDLIKHAPYIEAGAELPPGAITMAPHEDNAAHARVTVSDPRILNSSIPWPGPSRPGGSIADPIVPGVWQDSELVQYTITNHHLQCMGVTGSGKTLSLCYNEIGETVSRHDAAVLAWDIAKREQFLGVLRPCLHNLAVTKDDSLEAFAAIHQLVPERADFLAGKGLQKWEKGCGLTHLTCFLEECPDLLTLLDRAGLYDDFESDVRNARSAGIRWVLSLQRSDFTQMPTIIRSQLDYMCFGCKNEQDEGFGLSARQKQRGCSPADWGTRFPGKAYLDAACIPDERIAMPLRCYDWGRDSSLIAAHALRYPATSRPLDQLTASYLSRLPTAVAGARTLVPAGRDTTTLARPGNGQHPPQENDKPMLERLMRNPLSDGPQEPGDWDPQDVPPPGEPDEGDENFPPVPDNAFGRWQFDTDAPVREMEPADAKAAFYGQIAEWKAAGKWDFGIDDLFGLRKATGKSRPWLYTILDELRRDGVIRKHGRGRWVINKAGSR